MWVLVSICNTHTLHACTVPSSHPTSMQPEFDITTLFFLSHRPIPKIISSPNLVPILALNPNLTLKKYIELTKMELDRVYLDCNKKNSAFSYKKMIIKEGSAEGTTARIQSDRIIMEVSDL